MRRLWAGLGMAVALAAITAGGIVITQDDAPAAGTANLYTVASAAGSCTRSATPIDYATANSNGWTCGSFDAAHAAASCSDLVLVKAGTYPWQNPASNSKSCSPSTQIVFQPASGETPVIAGIEVFRSDYIKFRNFDLGSEDFVVIETESQASCSPGAEFITAENIQARIFSIVGYVCDIEILDSDFGPAVDAPSVVAPYNSGTFPAPHDVLVDGNTFSVSTSGSPGVHTECLHQWGNGLNTAPAVNITISNNVFDPCPVDAGSGTVTGALNISSGTDGLILENNFIGNGDTNGVGISFDSANVIYRYNSSPQSIGRWGNTPSACTKGTGNCGPWAFIGNYHTGTVCAASFGGYTGTGTDIATYSYNAVLATPCSGTDTDVASLDFINTTVGSANLHLQAPSTADGEGQPVTCSVATDIDAENRPIATYGGSGACDAGADEH